MPLFIAGALLLVWPTGGRYRRLGEANLRWPALFVVGLATQFAFAPVLGRAGVPNAPAYAWLLGAAILVLACQLNSRVFGLQLASLGITCNALVIAANRGMPTDEQAILVLGADPLGAVLPGTLYQIAEEGTRLVVLGDVLPVPGPLPMRGVASLGDMLLVVGVATAIIWAASNRAVAEDCE